MKLAERGEREAQHTLLHYTVYNIAGKNFSPLYMRFINISNFVQSYHDI